MTMLFLNRPYKVDTQMQAITIQYVFTLPDGSEKIFDITFDAQTLLLINPVPGNLPHWTRLDYHQCPQCLLTVEKDPYCLVATHLMEPVKSFDGLSSHDRVHVEINTRERRISQYTTAQRGIGSMMGLIFAVSGCPSLAFFRPMARFHLPLASEAETIFRATSMYLLSQYFRKMDGKDPDWAMKGLTEIYKNIQTINTAIAGRLRAATETDSSINAVIFLDMYAKTMPYVIREALEEIRYLFTPFLNDEVVNAGR